MKALHILFISHDDTDHYVVREYAEILGWFVTITASCDEGWNKAQSRNFDAILVDSACLEAIKSLRTLSGPNQQTPIVLVCRAHTKDILAPWCAEVTDVMVNEPFLLSTFKNEILRLASD